MVLLKSTRDQRAAAPNSGKVWTRKEDADLLSFFDNPESYRLLWLSLHFKRSKGAIVSRLVRFNRLTLVGSTYCRVEVKPWCTFADIDEKDA